MNLINLYLKFDIGFLADGLKTCQLCSHPLHLKDCIGERKFGLGHILLIRCCYEGCKLVNEVATGSKHKTIAGGTAWDVNTKLAAGKSYIESSNEIVLQSFYDLWD